MPAPRLTLPALRCYALCCLSLVAMVASATTDALALRESQIPDSFPRLEIGNHPADSMALRDLFFQHYDITPKATLWDEWLAAPSLWPATKADEAAAAWRRALLGRDIDSEGYVATHQHQSIAHQRGWPFPFWGQGKRGFGWHFSFKNTIGEGWRPNHLSKPEDITTTGAEPLGLQEDGLAFQLTAPDATFGVPGFSGDPHEAPFVQVRWKIEPPLPATATPYIEWTTEDDPRFNVTNRMYFDPPAGDKITYAMLPVYRVTGWRGAITGLRLHAGNTEATGTVILQAIFSQYDTRHNVNNPSFVAGSADYFFFTRDINFLRANIERMRLAMRYMETEFGTDTDGVVKMPWVGHEGTTGLRIGPDGKPQMIHGNGVGNNYWDLLPFGKQDSYATIRHYGAALKMADIEAEIAANPTWNIPSSPLARTPAHWTEQAAMAKKNGNERFFNQMTGRFTLGIDGEGGQADYGYTFLNLEAIAYDFATPEHAREIMSWIDGHRTVASDTSQTSDIYHWRFAPRASTRRNIDHYGWFWNAPQSIPFGDQVQDGGAVLGFSYHDIMARLRVNGPDDAAARLHEILDWYREVMAEGGYRAYYAADKKRGNLQGGNVPGGLGMDREFFESVMVPQVILEGFLGFKPAANDLSVTLTPRLPADWPSVTVTGIRYHGRTLTIRADHKLVSITNAAGDEESFPYKPGQPVECRLP